MPPDSADRSRVPRYVDQVLVEVLYSPNGSHRAAITRDVQGRLRVHVEGWHAHQDTPGRSGDWVPMDRMAILTDLIDRARDLAWEELRRVGAGDA